MRKFIYKTMWIYNISSNWISQSTVLVPKLCFLLLFSRNSVPMYFKNTRQRGRTNLSHLLQAANFVLVNTKYPYVSYRYDHKLHFIHHCAVFTHVVMCNQLFNSFKASDKKVSTSGNLFWHRRLTDAGYVSFQLLF